MGATGGTTHLAGGHEVVPFQGSQMLADGHPGQLQRGREFVHCGTGAALEQGEDLALSALYRHRLRGWGKTAAAKPAGDCQR